MKYLNRVDHNFAKTVFSEQHTALVEIIISDIEQ